MGVKKKNSIKRSVLGFYWRKAAFFVFLFAMIAIGYEGIRIFQADTPAYFPNQKANNLEVNLKIENDGSILIDGNKIKDRIDTTGDTDELILPIIDNNGISYASLKVTAILPQNIAKNVVYDIKGIHGVVSTGASIQDQSTIIFEASGLASTAIVSIILEMPKGTVNPPFLYQIYSWLNTVKSNAWVLLGLGLPIFTLIYMILFIALQTRRQKIDVPKEENDSPPMALPPAIVGVLFRQKVGPREIAATLIDLALRGDIYILDRERDFAFAKNRFDRRLLSYEKLLLSKIFRKELVSDRSEIEARINNHLYSRKISLVSSGIYQIATRLGYFQTNPQKTHLKYQLTGTGFFFLGIVGFVASLVFFKDPPYMAYFWPGMMFSGLIVAFTSKNIPNRTALGQEALSNWLAFRKYLSNKNKIPFSYESQQLFQKYLPYAIVFDCEVAWAKRFSEQNFMLPDWFVSDRSGMGMQEFCLSLFPLVSYVARSLAAIREPGFE